MKTYAIAAIPGDGIGQDVIQVGMKVLEALQEVRGDFRIDFESFPWSCAYYLEHGRMMPEDGLTTLESFDAIYLGAVGFPKLVPDHVSLWGLLLPIRKTFDLYVNLRPCRLLPGTKGILRGKGVEDIDFVCVRENTEGEYSGVGGRVHIGTPHEVAIQSIVFTRTGVERIMRYAFDLARRLGRRKVTSVTKSNAMQHNMVFWDEVFAQVAGDYPEIAHEGVHVDAMAARMVRNPETLDVVVASNLFADILTDLAGALQGSLGVPPSANVNPIRDVPGFFEPVHGSAPDIAGQGIANPIGAVWAASMMLDHLGEAEAARQIMAAIEALTADGGVLTPDLGGQATTWEVGDAICERLRVAAPIS
ncbi:MAG: tartrate dehydrogenase [Chloroflexi bacterium]|nr:tartrate dehydrogenase [Chloroflexota bacterium]